MGGMYVIRQMIKIQSLQESETDFTWIVNMKDLQGRKGIYMPDEKTKNLNEALTTNLSNEQDVTPHLESIKELSIPYDGISFYIIRISRAIVVRSNGYNFFVGRMADEDPSVPMLNLEDLEGFVMGVSRHHAQVRVVEQ